VANEEAKLEASALVALDGLSSKKELYVVVDTSIMPPPSVCPSVVYRGGRTLQRKIFIAPDVPELVFIGRLLPKQKSF
jgi:hypothetical protein